MNDVLAIRDQRGVGIKRVLEYRAQHDPIIGLKYVFGTVSVVDIEIDNCDPVDPLGQGVGCTHRDVVEDTESHSTVPSRVVPRWSDATEYRVDPVMYHHVDTLHHGTGCAVGGFQALWSHHRVRVEHYQAGPWRAAFDLIQIVGRVYATEVLATCTWRVKPPEEVHQTVRNKRILNGIKSSR
jgi:hypothetical protein